MAAFDPATLDRWRALAIVDRDGATVGTISEFYLDRETGHPTWALVETGLFGATQTFVPLVHATEIADGLQVPYEKRHIKDTPRVDPHDELTPDEEATLFAHYGVDYEPSAVPGGEGPEAAPSESVTAAGPGPVPADPGTTEGVEAVPEEPGTTEGPGPVPADPGTTEGPGPVPQEPGTTEGPETAPTAPDVAEDPEAAHGTPGTAEGRSAAGSGASQLDADAQDPGTPLLSGAQDGDIRLDSVASDPRTSQDLGAQDPGTRLDAGAQDPGTVSGEQRITEGPGLAPPEPGTSDPDATLVAPRGFGSAPEHPEASGDPALSRTAPVEPGLPGSTAAAPAPVPMTVDKDGSDPDGRPAEETLRPPDEPGWAPGAPGRFDDPEPVDPPAGASDRWREAKLAAERDRIARAAAAQQEERSPLERARRRLERLVGVGQEHSDDDITPDDRDAAERARRARLDFDEDDPRLR